MLLFLLIVNALVILTAFFLGSPPEQYFKEHAFVTYFSFVQLLGIAAVLACLYLKRKKGVWLVLTLAFVYLALDELCMLHEGADAVIHRLFHLKESGWSDRLDDLILGLFAILALCFLIRFKKETGLFHSHSKRLLVMAFVLLFFMVGIDLLTNRNDIAPHFNVSLADGFVVFMKVFDDILKLFSEAFFLAAFFGFYRNSSSLTH